MSSTRTVTFTINDINGNPKEGSVLVFKLREWGTTTNKPIYPRQGLQAVTNASGEGSITLWTNGESEKEAVYQVSYEDSGESSRFILPSGETDIDLSDLLINNSPDDLPSQVFNSLIDVQTGLIRLDKLPTLILAGLREGTRAEYEAADPPVQSNEPFWINDEKTLVVGSQEINAKSNTAPSLPFAAFNLISDQSIWRKAAKFTSTKDTPISATVRTTSGYARIMNFDGTLGDVAGSGSPSSNVAVAGETPPSDRMPRFYAIYPCDVAGALSGDLTYLDLSYNQLTSFDGTGLSSVTDLSLYNNQLTSFDGTGLSSVTDLRLYNNQLTSFDGTGLSSVTQLILDNNQLTSFDVTGLSSVTDLRLDNNQLKSFDGTRLSSVTDLRLSYNQLTSFDGTGLSSVTHLRLSNNQLKSFDVTGLSSVTYLILDNNQLTSFDGTGLSSVTDLSLYNNQLTSFDGTGLSSVTDLRLSNNQLTTVLLSDFAGAQPYTWTTYSLDLSDQDMSTDAVWEMLDSILSPAVDQPYPINLTGNPCDAGAGPALVEDGVHTQAEIELLLTAKGYSLQLTGGTIAP